MDPWAAAGAVIDAAFADPEPVIYTGAGLTDKPIRAIRSDTAAPTFEGPGSTLRQVSYEIALADLPQPPRKSDSFIHRARRWKPEDITFRDEIAKWVLVVAGPYRAGAVFAYELRQAFRDGITTLLAEDPDMDRLLELEAQESDALIAAVESGNDVAPLPADDAQLLGQADPARHARARRHPRVPAPRRRPRRLLSGRGPDQLPRARRQPG